LIEAQIRVDLVVGMGSLVVHGARLDGPSQPPVQKNVLYAAL
jgi:hypothetical protein